MNDNEADMKYKQARSDHEYLWGYAPAEDMTGAYVDQGDLKRLLETPTKAMAAECYCDQIVYWFDKGPDETFGIDPKWKEDSKIMKIAKRHNCVDEYKRLCA